MKIARTIAAAGRLVPVIGSGRGSPASRRRRTVPLQWRPAAPDREFPVLNLAIRPLWRIAIAAGPVHHEHFHAGTVVERGAAPDGSQPRGVAREMQAEILWRPRRASTVGPAGDRRGTPSAALAMPSADAGALRRGFALPGVQDRRRDHAGPAAQPALGWTRTRPVMVHGAPGAVMRMPAPATGASLPERAPGSPTVEATLPLRGQARSIVPGARAAPPRTAPVAVGRAASPVRAAVAPEAAPVRRLIATIRSAAASVAWRGAARTDVAPVRRRAPVEIAWAKPASQRETRIDLASLARTLAAGGAGAANPGIARSAATRETVQVASPDTGRLVDEVMERLDRRLRSDRLRRGL